MAVFKRENQIRILFTCVGRRVELISAFKNAADRLGADILIYGTDISESAPALAFCDRREIICRADCPDYIPRLIELCARERIDALIPTIDTDLLPLSQARERFSSIGTRAVISPEKKVKICRDKRITAEYFLGLGLKSPEAADDCAKYKGPFPCFIKPRDGSSSINAFRVDSPESLELYASRVKDCIIQPFIAGTEYTVDILCDFEGNPLFITPRERLAVRGGEVLKTRICQDELIKQECEKLVSDFRPCGPITVQLIRQASTGDDYYIEINPRFGGGAPLSIKAGADSAEALIRLLRGEKLKYATGAAEDEAVYSRFDQSIRINNKFSSPIPPDAVIFDLDDTLYSEKEYVKSGFRAVAGVLSQVENAETKLWKAFFKGLSPIDTVLQQEKLFTNELKQACLRAYRTHTPDICLFDGFSELLAKLRACGIKLGIITDGRPEGQRSKLKALGLENLVDEILITDELGGERFRKPCDIGFRIMQRKMNVPFERMVYVGDNVQKDFHAPAILGMQSILFKNKYGLYNGDTVFEEYKTVSSLTQLEAQLLKEG